MFPPELVERIVCCAWNCLSTSSHQHARSMTNWMLVSRDWLNIVVSIVFHDLWITSRAQINYIVTICFTPSFICKLGGITNVHRHLARTCRSLTISVYHHYEGEYASQCTDLIEYATPGSNRELLLPGSWRYRSPRYAIPTESLATVIRDFMPCITSLHFVLFDCTATYRCWNVPLPPTFMTTDEFPPDLVELHVTFAYTASPPTLLLDAPRGTFFPPSRYDMPPCFRFQGVRKLVVRDANADFVAFLTTVCPALESVESTAEFCVEDVPQYVPADVKARLVFVRLPRTATWGLAGRDAIPRPVRPPLASTPSTSARKKRSSVWRFLKRTSKNASDHIPIPIFDMTLPHIYSPFICSPFTYPY
ncbi:hypothetical protein C8J57DRAFT_1504820 [Mycena rebaudengoi]|nr:hypothetical protein C8J57DRAFT_1504820 [Mycena rebaudengoi]